MADRQPDETDAKLLALLEGNARLPAVALARAVGLSRSAVQERLARLEDRGAIAQYTIVRGDSAGAAGIRSILLVKIERRPCEAVLRRFRDWPEIVACWSVAGPLHDAVLVVRTADAEALGDLRERLAALPDVGEIVTLPVLRTVADRRTAAASAGLSGASAPR